MRFLSVAVIIQIIFLLTGCASTKVAPLENDTITSSLEKEEIVFWQASDKLEKQANWHSESFEGKTQVTQYLGNVMRNVEGDFNNPNMNTRVYVLSETTPNAFVLPNGAVYVTTGMLTLLDNEAQLATALAHEFYHFKNRHPIQEYRKNSSFAGLMLAGLVGSKPSDGNSIPGTVHYGYDFYSASEITGYSQELELEADRMALKAMLKAGYSKGEAINELSAFNEYMKKSGTKEPKSFTTHPQTVARIEAYKQLLLTDEVQRLVSGNIVKNKEYKDSILPAMLEDARLYIRSKKFEDAEMTINKCFAFHSNCAQGHFLLGEMARAKLGQDAKKMPGLEHYLKAIEIDPGYAPAYREIGFLYRYAGKPEQSRAYLSKYLAISPQAIDVAVIRSYLK
jgi:beta-barrel assembly-enhancing protease